MTPYEIALMRMHSDKEWQREFTIDRRIGFYQIKSEIGTGNFSHVKMAVHCLTRGWHLIPSQFSQLINLYY